MKFSKKTIVAVGMLEGMDELLKPLEEMNFLVESEVHFIHVFNTIYYTTLSGEFPLAFPVEADKTSIEKSVMAILKNISTVVLPSGFRGEIHLQCLFGVNPKEIFSKYVREQKANLVIVPTRIKHGLFDSSFAAYVTKHTSANMILLKNN